MPKNFDDMKFRKIYLYELWFLSQSIIKRCEKIFKEVPIPKVGYALGPGYEIHSEINCILSEAASIKKLITPPQKKTKGLSQEKFQFQVDRCNYLKDKIKHIQISEINSVKVRNSLQHFDEYLDEAMVKINGGKLAVHGMALYNWVISDPAATNVRPYPLRIYVGTEKKYYNMDVSIDLGKVYSEALDINKAIGDLFERDTGYTPGSLMLPL